MRLTALASTVLALLCVLPLRSSAAQQDETFNSSIPVFEFHSGFWVNLHHTLYHQARMRQLAADAVSNSVLSVMPSNLTEPEAIAWENAVGYYQKNYAGKDISVSLELILIKNQLGDFENCEDLAGLKKKSCDAGLPDKLTSILDAVAPVYRAHLWPEQDRINRKWIEDVAPLIRNMGLSLTHRLSDIYQTPWPRDRIWVDVAIYANGAGAYTTVDPLSITVSSTDPRNQGPEALEVLFREASHGISGNVQDAIARECRQREKPIPRDLWPALIYYTTGEVIHPALAARNPNTPPPGRGYVPYAVRDGMMRRGWNDYLNALLLYWQPYLDGSVSFDDAIAHIVSSL